MKHVIIGASAAGVSAAQTLRENDMTAEITVISDEKLPLYSRCLLTYLIAGSIDENKLRFKDANFYKDKKIALFAGKRAVSIDSKKKLVTLDDKTNIPFDRLLIATGASAKLDELPGINKKGVFTVRRIEDARAIINMLDKVKTVVVLGGGLIGLRVAHALNKRGKEVVVVVKSQHVLSQMVDRQAADMMAARLKGHGIKIMTGLGPREISGGGSVEAVLLDNNERLACEMVVIGKGVRPNSEIASSCGIKVDEGVLVDEYLQTSHKDIFAAGDVAKAYDIAESAPAVNAIWPCAVEQGRIAALNSLGENIKYDGSMAMNSIDFFDLACISIGITNPKDPKAYEIISKIAKEKYKKVVLKSDRIVGAIFVGDISSAGVVSILIKNSIDISSIKERLLNDDFDYAKIIPLVAKFKGKFHQEEFQDTAISY